MTGTTKREPPPMVTTPKAARAKYHSKSIAESGGNVKADHWREREAEEAARRDHSKSWQMKQALLRASPAEWRGIRYKETTGVVYHMDTSLPEFMRVSVELRDHSGHSTCRASPKDVEFIGLEDAALPEESPEPDAAILESLKAALRDRMPVFWRNKKYSAVKAVVIRYQMGAGYQITAELLDGSAETGGKFARIIPVVVQAVAHTDPGTSAEAYQINQEGNGGSSSAD